MYKMLNVGKWFNYNYENKTALPISQEQISKQIRYTEKKKPNAYKSINSSSIQDIRFLKTTNLTKI